MAEKSWDVTTKRFVAFFDILGFKDMVARHTHNEIISKLEVLKNTIQLLEATERWEQLKELKIEKNQTKAVTFSDSIIFFSKSGTHNDALKISFDCYRILREALAKGIAIKGAISFGQITVDFEKSFFFGQPIIDAYLLHEELEMLTVILDNHAEVKINSFTENNLIQSIVSKYKANLKSGKITHSLMHPTGNEYIKKAVEGLEKLYSSSYGRPRIYIDNTLDFFKTIA